LLDRRYFWQKRVKFAIVTEYDPAFYRDFGQPFVVGRLLAKFELAFGIVMVLNVKRGPRRPDDFRKARAKVTVKIER
jgi:hypothetical protein